MDEERDRLRMCQEWNEIARLNPFFGILSWPEFQDPACIDEHKFELSGKIQAENFLSSIGMEETRHLKMLEIGCGLGRMTHRFAGLFEEVYAIDVSQEMIDRARARWSHLHNIRFLTNSGRDLAGIADSSVHFVFSFLVLQHVTSPQIVLQYIKESGRVLKPSGIAFLHLRTVPSETGSHLSTAAPRGLRSILVAWLPAPLVAAARWLKRHLSRALKLSPNAWWNEGLWDSQARGTTESAARIRSKMVWRGCHVTAEQVRQACEEAGLFIRRLEGTGTQYTFLTAVKQECREAAGMKG